jgi:RNA polymerase sigma-70 factor, ECF subfamily
MGVRAMSAENSSLRPQLSDPTAFHQLFVQNQRRIFAHILTILPRLADAEEVFQQTCVIILGKMSQFTPGTDFVRWACQIAQYEVYNYRRRLTADRLCFDTALLKEIAACHLEHSDRLDAELDALRKCAQSLPLADRQLIQQRYSRKVTSRALAAELGRPANTVYKAIRRIRRALRQCIERAVKEDGR